MAKSNVVSLNPDSFQEGGLIQDVNVVIKEAQFCLWDYDGKQAESSLMLGTVLTDEEGKDHTQYFSAGDKQYFAPDDTGNHLVPIGDKTALNRNTNCAIFLASLVQAGFPVDKLETGVHSLVGTVVHIIRVPAPKRSGLIRTGPNAQKEQTILEVDKIVSMPGVGGGAGGKKTGLGASSSRPPGRVNGGMTSNVATGNVATGNVAAGDPEVDALANETLIGILAEAGGQVQKKALPVAANKALAGNPMRGKVVARIFDDAFLSSAEGITYDGATITLS